MPALQFILSCVFKFKIIGCYIRYIKKFSYKFWLFWFSGSAEDSIFHPNISFENSWLSNLGNVAHCIDINLIIRTAFLLPNVASLS